MVKKVSLILRIWGGFVLLALFITAGTFIVFHIRAKTFLTGELTRQLRNMAALGSLTLDREALTRLEEGVRNGTAPDTAESGDDFLKISDQLNSIRDLEPDLVLYAYTLIPGGDPSSALFLVDADLLPGKADGTPPEELARYGMAYDIGEFPLMQEAFGGKIVVEKELTLDEDYGVRSLSGYAPLMDRNGRVIGLLGLDVSDRQISRYTGVLLQTVIILTGLMLVVSLLAGLILARSLARPYLVLTRLFDQAEQGNLTLRFTTGVSDRESSRAAESFNGFMDSLVDSLSGFRLFTENLSDTALSIKEISGRILESQSAQESVLTDVEAVSEILTATVAETESRAGREREVVEGNLTLLNEVSGGLTRLLELSGEVKSKSDESFGTVENTLHSMEEILRLASDMAGITRELAADIGDIDERAERIGEIVQTIDSFADRLRTLSINTSIEAARIGKEGTGFRVIAQEIKKLAESVSDYLQTADEKVDGLKKSSTAARSRADNAAASYDRLERLHSESDGKLRQGKQAMLEIRESEEKIMESISGQKNAAEMVTQSSSILQEGVEVMIRILETEKLALTRVQESSRKLGVWTSSSSEISRTLADCSRNLLDWCSRLNQSLAPYHLSRDESDQDISGI